MKRIIILMLTLSAATLFYANFTNANSMRQGPFLVKQPDGSSFMAKGYGDEFFSWYETLDGYSVVRNFKDFWFYSLLKPLPLVVVQGDGFTVGGIVKQL